MKARQKEKDDRKDEKKQGSEEKLARKVKKGKDKSRKPKAGKGKRPRAALVRRSVQPGATREYHEFPRG